MRRISGAFCMYAASVAALYAALLRCDTPAALRQGSGRAG
jgi:hypothetical protein